MKKYYALLLGLSLFFAAHAQDRQSTDKRLSGIEPALSKLLKDWHVAGFAVAVVEKDKVIYSKGFGYRDYEHKKPVTANTLFAIGSSSKAFTCGLVGLLQKDGKVLLDNKIRDYLPDLHFYNDNMDANITVRDMMCHRTGLSRHDYSWYFFNTRRRDSMLYRVRYMEPTAGIREKWQYNNFMFLGQGVLVEKLTGRSWEDNIREKFFGPLEMKRSNLSIDLLQQDAEASLGYKVVNDSLIRKTGYYDIAGMGPAGSINSTAADMAHWVMMWINGGSYKGKEVLPPFYVSDAISAQMVMEGLPDRAHADMHSDSYGLGWFLDSYRGHYQVEHGGNIDGFSANISFFPTDSIGIVILTNQNGSPVPAIARRLIADRLLGLKYVDWSKERLDALAKAKKQQREAEQATEAQKRPQAGPSHPLKDYEGIYNNPEAGDIVVSLSHDTLWGTTGRQRFYLRHYGYDIFELRWIDNTDGTADTSGNAVRVIFRYNETGNISLMETPFEGGVKPIEFLYRPAAKAVTADELTQYTGNYELAGITIKVYTKGDILYFSVPGQPDYETVPTGNHTFVLKSLDGYSVQFEPGDNGAITSVKIMQPNSTFKAKKK